MNTHTIKIKLAGHGGACLQSQYWKCRGRKISVNLGQPSTHSKFQVNWGYIVMRLYLKQNKTKTNQTKIKQ